MRFRGYRKLFKYPAFIIGMETLTEIKILDKLTEIKIELDYIKGHIVDDIILTEDDKIALVEARKEYKEGKTIKLEDLKKEIGL